MRLLRGPYFILVCVLAVIVGVGIGSGWYRHAWTAFEQSPATLGIGAPPGPIRLRSIEYAGARRWVAKVMEGKKVPELTDLFSQIAAFDFTRAPSSGCHRLNGPEGCRVEKTTPFFRALLAESDPTIEDLFLVVDRPPGRPHAESIRTAFILGKDGRTKMIVETPGDVRALTARIAADGAGEDRRIAFRLWDKSTRVDPRDHPPVSTSFAVFIADDPGELKPLPDGSLPFLLLQEERAAGEQPPRTLAKLVITPGLAQRHRLFAALKHNALP